MASFPLREKAVNPCRFLTPKMVRVEGQNALFAQRVLPIKLKFTDHGFWVADLEGLTSWKS